MMSRGAVADSLVAAGKLVGAQGELTRLSSCGSQGRRPARKESSAAIGRAIRLRMMAVDRNRGAAIGRDLPDRIWAQGE